MTFDIRSAVPGRTGRRARLAAAAAVLAGLALTGCSSSGSSSKAGPAPTSGAVTPAAAAGTSGAPSDPQAAPSEPQAAVTLSASTGAQPAGNRPADPCSLLTNDQVTRIMGASTPILAEGASTEKPYSCTWGSRMSYVDVSEVGADEFNTVTTATGLTRTPLTGIGDSAFLAKDSDDGGNPEVVFTVGGRNYSVEALADRRDAGPTNAPKEAAAEQQLAAIAAKALKG
ncbi:hypothetical protein ACFYNO_35860 [Kitasatospora sp. NPDC006697]|uniref:hypothetical protein n=1 Tax=Kitasatospora sp. NPDC006697 TaxID=3364020 RepID=UPI0036BE8170